MSHVWTPLLLSLRIAAAATVLTALVAVPLAFVLARRRFVGKSAVEALIVVPLVLPPTVVGYLLIMAFGSEGWLGGQWLWRQFGYSILFRVEGAVLAAATVALPMLYLPAKAAFASVDRELEETARLLGASRLQLFWHVSLPLARKGLASGMILAFARALGEFGATMMVFGWQSRRGDAARLDLRRLRRRRARARDVGRHRPDRRLAAADHGVQPLDAEPAGVNRHCGAGFQPAQ